MSAPASVLARGRTLESSRDLWCRQGMCRAAVRLVWMDRLCSLLTDAGTERGRNPMASGNTSQLRIRAQEIEALLRGLPSAVLKSAFEVALARIEVKARALVKARLALCKTRDD